MIESNYAKYRGKCKEMSQALVKERPELRLVRGYYDCPMMGRQQHWWCEEKDGTIVDPTVLQFPSAGIGDYIEFDGWCTCDECGAKVHEDDAVIESNYAFCTTKCFMVFVGIADRIVSKPADCYVNDDDYEEPF